MCNAMKKVTNISVLCGQHLVKKKKNNYIVFVTFFQQPTIYCLSLLLS